MQYVLHNQELKKVGDIELPDAIFGAPVKKSLLWEQNKAQLASRRAGTHSTKNRGEVRGGGAKPFRQKGTGRARQGSSRSPIHVGGGRAFGPKPRDYSYRLPKSARVAALKSALSLRVGEQALYVLDKFELGGPKTKDMVAFLGKLGSESALLVDATNDNLRLSTRNLQKSRYLVAEAVNVRDILNHENLVMTRAAVDLVVSRLERKPKGTGEVA